MSNDAARHISKGLEVNFIPANIYQYRDGVAGL